MSTLGSGYLFGIGADYRLSSNITIGAVPQHHELGDFDQDVAEVNAATFGLDVAFAFAADRAVCTAWHERQYRRAVAIRLPPFSIRGALRVEMRYAHRATSRP